MQLLVVRHAMAEDREGFPGSDAERELTERGRKRMRRGARALPGLVPRLARVATSPLLRAAQTAEVVAEAYGAVEIVEVPFLAPGGDVQELVKWLAAQPPGDCVAIVGHEPDLSAAISWLVAGRPDSRVELGKGGAALVDFPGPVDAGSGFLLWLLRPGQLRAIA